MNEIYACSMCGKHGEEEDFETDVNNDVEAEDMVCESCYDEM